MTIRLVLDTNVLISAVLTPNGPAAEVLLIALQQPDFQLCISGAVYAEYEEVIRRPRFQRSESEIESILAYIRDQSRWVKPTTSVQACSDPRDDIFLECAAAADAQYLVTGNTRHFPPFWAETQIITPRQFLETVA